jgi:glycosyltransferase involved in cell wall biosynthesis
MRILQVVQEAQRRGAEVFASQLSRQLRRMSHEVKTAYLYRHEGENPLPLDEHDTVLGGDEHHCLERIPGVHPLLLWRLKRLIEETQPDVVQVNGGRTVKYGAAIASGRRRRSWVLIYRNIGQLRDWVRGWHHTLYSRLVMPNVDGVVGVSRVTLQTVEDLFQLSVPAVRIPSAVDTEMVVPTVSREVTRRQAETPLEAPVIVWVGSLTPEKRVDRLIRAADVVRRSIPNLHLWIVGGGPLRRTLEAEVQARSLTSYVRFLGVQERVANYMNAGDVVTLTSDTEGMPAVLLEAGLLGRPVVATRVGGVSECVLDGETGILVERNDEEALATALRDLLRQPEQRCRMGQASRGWIERNFTMSRVAQDYAAFYQQVLRG